MMTKCPFDRHAYQYRLNVTYYQRYREWEHVLNYTVIFFYHNSQVDRYHQRHRSPPPHPQAQSSLILGFVLVSPLADCCATPLSQMGMLNLHRKRGMHPNVGLR